MYIVQTWRSSLRSTREHAATSPAEFRREVDSAIDRIMSRKDTSILVAAPSADDEQSIAGWLVYTALGNRSDDKWTSRRSDVLHYLYVRRAARGTGCARQLCDAAGIPDERLIYTFRGPAVSGLLAKAPQAIYIDPQRFLA